MNPSMSVVRCAAVSILAAAVLFPVRPGRAELPADRTVNEIEACLSCHDLEGLGARVQHAPVEAGECSACHNPHVARFSSLLRDRPGPLCQTCHSELQTELVKPRVHAPVAAGECSGCHDPHGSDLQGLLIAAGGSLCGNCHSNVEQWQGRQVKHAPFSQGRCSTCHEAHASDAPGLLRGSSSQICFGCHSADATFKSSHKSYPVERAACHQCHDPHASAQRGLFRETIHPPFENGDCTACHAAAGSPEPFATVTSQDRLCGKCHADQVVASREASSGHISAGGGNCTACHNPHAGDGPSMLLRDQQSVCLSCHNPGGASSGEAERYRTHAEGKEDGDLPCSTCHAPHGSEQPLLFVSDSVELCGSCHTHEHGIRHPLGEETRDPRTGSPMTCLSCHGIHHADSEMYLFESPERDLCVGCHKEMGGQ